MAMKWIVLICLLSVASGQVEEQAPGEPAGASPTTAAVPQDPAVQGQESPVPQPGSSTEGPLADIVFAGGECTQKCAHILGDLNEVADPKNIEKVIRDLDSLCERYQNAIQCATTCNTEEKANFDRSTALLQYTCVEKREMLQQLGSCMTQHQEASLKTCEEECGSLDDLVNVDNSTAPTDPQQIFAKMGPVCNGLKCTIKCMKADMNSKCPGAGDFIRDIAVKQVEEAGNQLMKDVNDPTNPMAENLAKILKETLPNECSYMLAPQQFRDAIDGGSSATETSTSHPEPEPGAPAGSDSQGAASSDPSSSASDSQSLTEDDNRTIKKDPMEPQNAAGTLIASTLTTFLIILLAYI